jgi:hypothetical protein
MHIFWHREVPPLEQGEIAVRQAYQDHKLKIRELETVKKEC